MKMHSQPITRNMKKLILLLIPYIFSYICYGQFFSGYGINIGLGLSNQHWKYNTEFTSEFSHWNDNKIGFIGQFYVEKEIFKFLTIKPSIGYIQKGFVSNIKVANVHGEIFTVKDDIVVLHNLSFDLAFRVIPFEKFNKLYFIIGSRLDYLIDYSSVMDEYIVNNFQLFRSLFENYNKITFGGIIGLGISFEEIIFLTIDYNPAFTKNFDSTLAELNISDSYSIYDQYFSLTIGLNIGQLIKK